MPENRIYIAIDLKSFYASVECAARGLDALKTNLVVADISRTEKTICLAVSPSLKAYGISGRARLFEVVQRVKEVNTLRRRNAPRHEFIGKSYHAEELNANPALELDYIVAPPHMSKYMQVSAQIYKIYLRYIAPEDMHVYSVDEVFIDVTAYLGAYGMTARQLAIKMIHDVLAETGITATAGIGTNLYLCKVAMDIVAKKIPADKDGVRIAELDEASYRRELWGHRPLTDFWRVGRGYSAKLEQYGLFTMGDIARCSLGGGGSFYSEELLYKLFGVNAELLIDHAWGWEPCGIPEIKAYRPKSSSVSTGQVLKCPYDFEKGRLVMREMADMLSLDLVGKGVVTDRLVIDVGYDISCAYSKFSGEVTSDRYGRRVPRSAHGSVNLGRQTASTKMLVDAVTELYEGIVNPQLLVRRLNLTANNVISEAQAAEKQAERPEQLDFFTDYDKLQAEKAAEDSRLAKEKNMQLALLKLKKKYGKNAVLRGRDYIEGATAIERNGQVGGHKA